MTTKGVIFYLCIDQWREYPVIISVIDDTCRITGNEICSYYTFLSCISFISNRTYSSEPVYIANSSNIEHMNKVYRFGADLMEEENEIHVGEHSSIDRYEARAPASQTCTASHARMCLFILDAGLQKSKTMMSIHTHT